MTAAADHGFRMLMFGLQAQNRAGIGLFGRLQVERADSTHRGEIDLKLHGTLPLVGAVRLLALSRGIAETGTLARIDALGPGTVEQFGDPAAGGSTFFTRGKFSF